MNRAALPRRASGVILLVLCAQVVTLNLGPCLLSCWRAGREAASQHQHGSMMPGPMEHHGHHMAGSQVSAPGQCHTVTLLVIPFTHPQLPAAPVVAAAVVPEPTWVPLPPASAVPAFDTPPPRV
jgi:hypothetical protein